MYGSKQLSLKTQRGVSLSGLIVVLAVIIAVAMLGMKVFPPYLEFRSARDAIASAKATGADVRGMRLSFDKNADVNGVTSISSKDLVFTRESSETEISFDYEKRIPLFTNVDLGIRFLATTNPSGKMPDASSTGTK